MDGSNKYSTGRSHTDNPLVNFKTVEIGIVVSVTDPQGMDRIKVTINGNTSRGGDNGIAIEDLAWCQPLVPKFFTSKPKIGESVYIFTFGIDKSHADRLYMGPIIAQAQNLNFDAKATTSLSGFDFGNFQADVDIARVPELKGVFPTGDDIAIQGRYNTDLIFRPNEVLMRAGKFVESEPSANNPYPFQFNTKTQGFIQLKNDVVLKKDPDALLIEKGSVANIVANKINLLTHKDGAPRFDLTNQQNLISDEEMAKILEDAHPVAFGDIMIQYLKLLKNAFLNHVHNGSGRQPTDLTAGGNTQFVAEFIKNAEDLEKLMLSKNIKIN